MDILSLCASWFSSLPQDNWKLRLAAGVVLALLAGYGHRKSDSVWTSAEYLSLATGYAFGFRVGYPLFQLIKLLVALLFFLVEFFFSPSETQRKPLEYLPGFASDKWHSAIARGTATVDKDEVDSSFNRSAQKIIGHPHAFDRRTVGRTLLVDVDKGLTRGGLLHLRWSTWVLICLEVLLVISDLPCVTIGYIGEVGLLLSSLFDSLNRNKQKADKDMEMTTSLQRPISDGLLKGLFIVLGCVAAHVFLPAGCRGGDLLLLVLASFASSFVVHFVLSASMAPNSAPSTDNESSHTDGDNPNKVD